MSTIKTQFDLSEAARAAAIAADDVPATDRLKTTQAAITAFAATGLDDANYTAFEAFFAQARGQQALRVNQRKQSVIVTVAPETTAPAATA